MGVQATVWRFLMQHGEPRGKWHKKPLTKLIERMVELSDDRVVVMVEKGHLSPLLPELQLQHKYLKSTDGDPIMESTSRAQVHGKNWAL